MTFDGGLVQPPDLPEQTETPRPAMSRGTGWALGIALVLVLAVAGTITFLALGHADRAARGACRRAVKAQISTPATAKFSDEVVDRHGDKATVTGELDAQNDAGAMVHGYYHCDATQQAGTWSATATVDGF